MSTLKVSSNAAYACRKRTNQVMRVADTHRLPIPVAETYEWQLRGACRGMVFGLRREHAEADLEQLWAREMPTGVYDPRWLPVRTPQGEVKALAFTLSRRSEAFMGRIADEQMLHILRHASGRYGSTLQYLAATAHALRERGVHDREVQRLMALAARHGLL